MHYCTREVSLVYIEGLGMVRIRLSVWGNRYGRVALIRGTTCQGHGVVTPRLISTSESERVTNGRIPVEFYPQNIQGLKEFYLVPGQVI